jgi:tetratricopeptide (TPR) repeat protein
LGERYTRSEARRIVGVDDRRLRYWERLRLVRPRIRWGERFYDFGDLVALRTIKRLTDSRVPARRLRRAVSAIERQLGGSALRVENLRLLECRQSVAFVLPGEMAPPFDPLELQWILPLQGAPASSAASNVHQLGSRSAEEWFEIALAAETSPETVDEAVEAYQRVIEISPEWVEAHINLGVALYHQRRLEDAQNAFLAAVALDPANAICRYNLGCVYEEAGKIDEAIENLRCAIRAMPNHADAHFNLALAYEKKGDPARAREHWSLYLKHDPRGTWAEKARTRIEQLRPGRKLPPPIPFPVRREAKIFPGKL